MAGQKNIIMKTSLLILVLSIIGAKDVMCQEFYVKETESGIEQPVVEKLEEMGYKVLNKEEKADFIIKCIATKQGLNISKGQITIYDKEGNTVSKSKPVKASPAIWNGYSNAQTRAIKKIADSQLEKMIKSLKL